ncbi:MAG: 7,8-didemethyl-8-hydroxy-5-deazariboflavin synthase CofG [Polyangiaceae bacterium]|nr:7,8-didemethyl-8-hydroxy-5-deazariboflavin synthase CofG [Polyangiaceae bacterium]
MTPSVDEALAWLDDPGLLERARRVRDDAWGATLTYSPKVFLPVTNLCRNRCDYCSYRRSPGDAGERTMTRDDVERELARAETAGCKEALLCLGDKPEKAFSAYRETLAGFGHASTVSYLVELGERALARGLLPHTNAGLLTRDDMIALRRVNASLGLMLESASERLCAPGMPHHRAPDKRPRARLAMIAEAGRLKIPFTTGILIGIGETTRERAEALLAIRALHEEHGHVQEVIVQPFRARPGVVMDRAPEPSDHELAATVALARLVLPPDVSVQAPPNLSPDGASLLISAGLNDWGGISPVTPDFINHLHPWPEVSRLRAACEAAGFALAPRLCVYPGHMGHDFLDPSLRAPVDRAARELSA